MNNQPEEELRSISVLCHSQQRASIFSNPLSALVSLLKILPGFGPFTGQSSLQHRSYPSDGTGKWADFVLDIPSLDDPKSIPAARSSLAGNTSVAVQSCADVPRPLPVSRLRSGCDCRDGAVGLFCY
jgi:hypothetical protein